jgi:ATP synthase F0 subunit b
MEQLWEFLAELVAFVAIVYVLWRYVRPRVSEIIRTQQDTIQKQVDAAKAASERLAAADLKYKEALAESRTEAAKIRDAARADAQRIAEEMREHAQREVERIRQRGQEDLETQRLHMIRELRGRIGELTVAGATELITAHLSDDAHRASTVDRLLDELEAMSAPAAAEAGTGAARKSRSRSTAGKGKGDS